MTTARAIAAIDLPGIEPAAIPDARPELTWIDPRELVVDDSYQRGLGERSTKLIRKIVAEFSWAKFKAPTAVWTEAGLEVVDGQHSAVAAACHPNIGEIPVLVVAAAELEDRARGFVAINRDRLSLTATQLHHAAVVAGDKLALAIERVCAAAGVTVRRAPPGGRTQFGPRETVATGAIGALISRCGEALAVEILHILADADLAPIGTVALKAAELLVVDEEFAGAIDPAELTKAIAAMRDTIDKDARAFAATHCTPLWKATASVWFKAVKKRKGGTAAAETAPAPRKAPTGVPLPLKRTSFEPAGYSAGDPPPGRSALDQRRAER